ncbi:MAG: M15 family metallopeptidase [Kineosporiaceae bacterium]
MTTILLSDPRVAAMPVQECGEPLVALPPRLTEVRAAVHLPVLVRAEVAARLAEAARRLPRGVRLAVVEGWRDPRDQLAIIRRYTAELRALHPDADDAELAVLSSRFVSPLDVAPHVAGAAVDLTLTDSDGIPLDLGTPIDATPEASEGRCWFDAPGVPAQARVNRALLADVLTSAGFVNYPTEWWHWSFGDRYWALTTGRDAALFGPCRADARAARAA